ncbi:MAG: hypothetical protein AAGF15_04675 [Pseudomonadota bacterium]
MTIDLSGVNVSISVRENLLETLVETPLETRREIVSSRLDIHKLMICCVGTFLLVGSVWAINPDPVGPREQIVWQLSNDSSAQAHADRGNQAGDCPKEFLLVAPEEKKPAKKKSKRRLLPTERLGLTIPLSNA